MDEVDMEKQALINRKNGNLLAVIFILSSNPSEEFSQIGNELNKKRKLHCELNDLELPLSKQKFKFRDVVNSFNHESMAKQVTQHEEKLPRGKEVGERSEEEESDGDSIISIEDYDSALQAKFNGSTEENLSGRSVFRDRPSTSSNSSSNDASGSSIISFNSDNSATVNSTAENGQSENDFEFGSECKDTTEALLQGLEEFDDNIGSEILRNDMECSDAEILPNAFVLPSGQWSLGQDTQSVARKLTIDQEFEQYFSMLML